MGDHVKHRNNHRKVMDMDIKSILKKVAEGKDLTAEEKDFLSSYDPDTADGRIPKQIGRAHV